MTAGATRLSAALADRYRLEHELGAGGMATVYLAHDLKHDRDVAIKVLHPDLGAALGGERFLAEIRTTARLQHPHILPLLDSGRVPAGSPQSGERADDGGLLYYVMPYVAGETLRGRLEREKQLPLDDALRIGREVADALAYAHGQGVIHRDIKPENILLHGGHALVADFGIALAISAAGGSRMTQTGLSLGTPSYMAPEQAMGEKTLDARVDVYALGAVCYEMLTGEPPFTGATVQAIVAKVLTERPTPVRTVRDTVPARVDGAILKALAKLPADRFASAAELGVALADTELHSAPTRGAPPNIENSAVPASDPHRASARRITRARRLAPWTVAAAALAVSGWLALRPAPRPAEAPVNRFEVLPPAGSHLLRPTMGRATFVAISRDGQRVAFVVDQGPAGRALAMRRLDELTARVVPGTVEATDPAFSPDGRWLAFVDAAKRIRKVAVDGSAATTICTVGGTTAGLTWVSDREIVFASSAGADSAGLYRVSADGGTPTAFSRPDRRAGETYQLSPVAASDGSLLFYTSSAGGSSNDLSLGVVRTRDRTVRILRSLRGARVVGMVHDIIVYVRGDGVLMAVPFDARTLTPGAPIEVGDSVATNGFGAAAALSESGALSYQASSGVGELLRVSETGEAQPLLPAAQRYVHPRLSPDGRKLAFEQVGAASADIWVVDLASGTLERLTRTASNDRPEWSPDGRRVLYLSTRTQPPSVWWQTWDGSAPAEQLHIERDGIREAVLTPDGRTLLYRIDTPTDARDILRVAVDGADRRPTRLLAGPDDDKQPRPSPDGKWLAYVSNASGREEVYVRALDGGGGGRVVVSSGGGGEPLWSRDGRLFYRAGDSLFVATLATTPTLALTGRRFLFAGPYATDPFHPNYDVASDGRSFVMIRPLDKDLRFAIVLNWTSELERRLGRAK